MQRFSKILVANRSEIAIRVMRAANRQKSLAGASKASPANPPDT